MRSRSFHILTASYKRLFFSSPNEKKLRRCSRTRNKSAFTKTKCFRIFIGLRSESIKKTQRGDRGESEKHKSHIHYHIPCEHAYSDIHQPPPPSSCSISPSTHASQEKIEWKLYNICLWIYRRIYDVTKLPASHKRWKLQFDAVWYRSAMAKRKLPSKYHVVHVPSGATVAILIVVVVIMSRQSSRAYLAVKYAFFSSPSSLFVFSCLTSSLAQYTDYARIRAVSIATKRSTHKIKLIIKFVFAFTI